jgi:Heat shock protein
LISLDQKGNEIKGELEQNYILDKIDDTLIGKRWKLVELMGQPVVTPEGGKEAFMILRHDGNVSGDFGCNVFNGTYNLRKGDRIHFLPAISTMMMCSNMETEQKFKEVLETVDNYNYIDGNKLVLNRARMAPLARFEIE